MNYVSLEEALRLGTEAPRLKTFDVNEFALMALQPRDVVLAPIVPAQGLAMLYGQRGVAKTFVATGIAHAVATGGMFLRWAAPERRKVLLVDGEMPAIALQERVRLAGMAPQPGYLRLLPMDLQDLGVSINLARDEDQRAIEAEIQDAELLVLDNLSTLVNGGRENDAESWSAMQAWLLRLRRQGVSVLLVHHAARGEHARGTSKREDVLDTVIHLKRPSDYHVEEGARFEVHLTKARGVHGEHAAPFEAKLETSDGVALWTTRTLVDVEVEQVAELTRGGKTVRDIAGDVGISRSKVNRIQKKLKDEGRL
jgi:putative DNA primase/helicase